MKNRVLLINPEINPKTQKKFVTAIVRASFPFSLGHLAGYVMRNGDLPLKIVDDQIAPITDEALERLIAEMEPPKILGMTALTATSARAYELAGLAKKYDPGMKIVLGGVHASVMPEEGLSHKSVDMIVRGEGEITFDEIIDCVSNERDYRQVKGISYRDNGEIVSTEDRPLIKDLNSLPHYPYHLFEADKDRYPGFFSVQTSRGCPYGCTFCSQRSITRRSYRYVSTERAIHDIETLADKYGGSLIRIMDDNIAANKKRLMALLDAIIEKGLHKRVSFEAPMRGDNINEDIVDRLKEANFGLVTFGLETASESLMKLINKGETVKQVADAIEMTAGKGISVGTTLIFGLPTETNRDRWDAIKLVSSLPLDSVRFNILTPYPGTPIYNDLVKENKVRIKKDWENFSVQYMWEGDELPYVPDGTNPYDLMFQTMLANLWFYIRPSGLKKLFTKRVAGGNVIQLNKAWYFSGFLFKILRVGLYLGKRFAVVFAKMLLRKVFPKQFLSGQ